MMGMDIFQTGRVALVTGGASGIGLAACRRFLTLGLSVAMVDRDQAALDRAVAELSAGDRVHPFLADIASRPALADLSNQVLARFGHVDLLMANAAIQPGSSVLDDPAGWDQVLSVNLHGTIATVQTFLPGMIAANRPGLVIVTGSKQGITTPPGDPAYNVAKAGVKAFAEAVQHDLRNHAGCGISAHLLIPGFVYTSLTRGDRKEKPDAAWTPDQTIAFMMERLADGDFYILCPDNDVSRPLDEKRILWAAGDIVENRPPLSRWHPDYKDAFARFTAGV
jgi:NAD(P)-dependent dehydrogenase (short-subunit alcohol dehydrogenase family)